MKTLETERLILRDWAENDVDDLFALMSDPSHAGPDGKLPEVKRDVRLTLECSDKLKE